MSRIHLDSPSSTKPHIVCIHELRGQKSWLTVCMLMHVISIWIRRSEPEILLKITITPIRFTFPLLYLLSSLIASADFIHLNVNPILNIKWAIDRQKMLCSHWRLWWRCSVCCIIWTYTDYNSWKLKNYFRWLPDFKIKRNSCWERSKDQFSSG